MENDILASIDHILNTEKRSAWLLPLLFIFTLALVAAVDFFFRYSSGPPSTFKKLAYATALMAPSVAFVVMIWGPTMRQEASCRTVINAAVAMDDLAQQNEVADAFSVCLRKEIISDAAEEFCPMMGDRLLQSPSERLVGEFRNLCGQDALDALILRQKG